MNVLTEKELRIFNSLSIVHDPTVKLGDKVQEVVTGLNLVEPPVSPEEGIEEGSPVNAISAKETLTLTGVVIHGETIEIGDDVYQFAADDLQTVTRPEFIAVDITAGVGASIGALTMDAQPESGDTITIGEKVFIFVPVGTDTADGEVSIGVDLAGAQAALVAAINGTDGVSESHPLVSASDFVANVSTITALVGGTAGDTIATTETFTAGTNGFAAVVLGSGSDCIAADAITALIAAIVVNDTQGVTGAKGVGDTVVLTADVAGDVGNNITIDTDMANASFTGGATELSGGVDGTVSDGIKFMMDNTYLYICIAANSATGTNWRRVSLGAVY